MTTIRPCHIDDVTVEHRVLLRHWAGMQDRVSRQACEQARRCDALEAELLRLRARWIVATSQMLWGLGWPGLRPTRPTPMADADDDLPATASAWICQTGCASQAHPWLGEDGECRLNGGDCTRLSNRTGQTSSSLS